jgi:hypothetical protein
MYDNVYEGMQLESQKVAYAEMRVRFCGRRFGLRFYFFIGR